MTAQSLDGLAQLALGSPDDGVAAFDYASALDANGREADAIPVYRRALECELPDQQRHWASVQLGSSLRVVGEAEGSVAVHREALERWPRDRGNRLFLALALLAANQSAAAVSEAIVVALATEGNLAVER